MKKFKSFTDKEIDFEIENLKSALDSGKVQKSIESKFVLKTIFELIVLLVQLIKEKRRRENGSKG